MVVSREAKAYKRDLRLGLNHGLRLQVFSKVLLQTAEFGRLLVHRGQELLELGLRLRWCYE